MFETHLSPPVRYFTDISNAVILLTIIFVIYVLCLPCFRVRLLLTCGRLLGQVSFVIINCVLSLSLVVFWLRCGT